MKDFLGNELAVGDEVVFMTCQEDTFQIGKVEAMDTDEDNDEILFINPHFFWNYASEVIKVIRE